MLAALVEDGSPVSRVMRRRDGVKKGLAKGGAGGKGRGSIAIETATAIITSMRARSGWRVELAVWGPGGEALGTELKP